MIIPPPPPPCNAASRGADIFDSLQDLPSPPAVKRPPPLFVQFDTENEPPQNEPLPTTTALAALPSPVLPPGAAGSAGRLASPACAIPLAWLAPYSTTSARGAAAAPRSATPNLPLLPLLPLEARALVLPHTLPPDPPRIPSRRPRRGPAPEISG